VSAEKRVVSGIILAGGKNLRFGRVKTLEVIGGRTIFQRVVDSLQPISDQILIVVGDDRTELPAIPGIEVVQDLYPGAGPLGGIFTGMVASRSETNLVVASDMPFLSTALLNHLVEVSDGHDVVIPVLQEDYLIEPLHAVYSRKCLPKMKQHLDRHQLSIRQVFRELKVLYVEEEECRRYDPQLLSFFNINVPSDLDLAMEIDEKEKAGGKR